jgi:hypothetical protein
MRRWVVIGAVAAGLVCAGCFTPAPTPPDRAVVASVQVASTVTRNQPFVLDVFAEDLGSNDYTVTLINPGSPPDLHALNTVCNGTQPGEPSADGTACEYDNRTTTTSTVTKTGYTFVWNGSTGVQFTIEVCAASFTNPPTPFPTGGSCVTKPIAVAT